MIAKESGEWSFSSALLRGLTLCFWIPANFFSGHHEQAGAYSSKLLLNLEYQARLVFGTHIAYLSRQKLKKRLKQNHFNGNERGDKGK